MTFSLIAFVIANPPVNKGKRRRVKLGLVRMSNLVVGFCPVQVMMHLEFAVLMSELMLETR